MRVNLGRYKVAVPIASSGMDMLPVRLASAHS
jgi:hypothetical protein